MIEASDKALHLGKRSAPHGEAQRSTWGNKNMESMEVPWTSMDGGRLSPSPWGAPAPPSQAAVTELHLKRPGRSADPD